MCSALTLNIPSLRPCTSSPHSLMVYSFPGLAGALQMLSGRHAPHIMLSRSLLCLLISVACVRGQEALEEDGEARVG